MRILEEFWYGNIEPTEYDTLLLGAVILGVNVKGTKLPTINGKK